MAFFPIFTDLKGKRCVVIGGGEVAFRKIMILLQFDGELSVIAPEVSRSIEELGKQGEVNITKKEYSEKDIDGAFLVIAATSSREVNERVFRDAGKRSIPVNTVDDPEKCSFIFPSIIKRGNLTIGISTSGSYPALSKKLREKAEEVFTEEYEGILSSLADFRMQVRKSQISNDQKVDMLKQAVDVLFERGKITKAALDGILEEYETQLREGGTGQWTDPLE